MSESESALEVSTRCPICLEPMSAPIKQCTNGHSICGICIDSNNITICPICRSAMTSARNYQLEEVMQTLKNVVLKIPCMYSKNGCKEEVTYTDENGHQLDCLFKNYDCEGKKFADWNCTWTGQHKDILEHFKTSHKEQVLEFKGDLKIKIDSKANSKKLWLVNFYNGSQIFWLKHYVNIAEEGVYFFIQYVGSKEDAANYYYEAEISNGNIRKLKVTDICGNQLKNDAAIWKSEEAATFTLTKIKSFLNGDGELQFRFRVMGIKKEENIPQKPKRCDLSEIRSYNVPECNHREPNRLDLSQIRSYNVPECNRRGFSFNYPPSPPSSRSNRSNSCHEPDEYNSPNYRVTPRRRRK